MLAVQSIFLLVLLAVCCFSPGFFFLRRFPWTPLEKLCGSIGLSLIFLYLTTWFVYVAGGAGANTPMSPVPFVLASSTCVVIALISRKDIASLLRASRTRRVLLGYAFLLLWTFLLLTMI